MSVGLSLQSVVVAALFGDAMCLTQVCGRLLSVVSDLVMLSTAVSITLWVLAVCRFVWTLVCARVLITRVKQVGV